MAAEAQVDVLDGWSRLVQMVPPSQRTRQLPEYLAGATGVPLRRIVAVRGIRNRIAHEGTHSVSDENARRAAQTIREMQRALAPAEPSDDPVHPARERGRWERTGPAPGAAPGAATTRNAAAAATARIVFYRPLRWGNAARSYNLRLDGAPCGTVRVSRELAIEVAPGFHTAEARIDWSSSPALGFSVQPGQVLRIRVEAVELAKQVSGVLSFNWKSMLRLSID